MRALVTALCLLVLAGTAQSHGMQVTAVITVDSATGAVTVALVDPYKNPAPGAAVRVAAGEPGSSPRRWTALKEGEPGVHQGALPLPLAGGTLHIAVEWPEERWIGEGPLQGEGALNINLTHIEERSGLPWWTATAMVLAVAVIAWGIWDFARHRGGK